MDMYEFAMKMELDGQEFYERQAAATQDKQLKEILMSLAEEEKNHYDIFKQLRDNQVASIGELATGNDTLNKIKNIFVEISTSKKHMRRRTQRKSAYSRRSPMRSAIIST
jgi:hypothetical protein